MDHLTTTAIESAYLKATVKAPDITLRKDNSDTFRVYERLEPIGDYFPSSVIVMRDGKVTGFLWFKKIVYESNESLILRAKQMYIDYVNKKLKGSVYA